MTDSSAVSKADTVSHRGKIVKGGADIATEGQRTFIDMAKSSSAGDVL